MSGENIPENKTEKDKSLGDYFDEGAPATQFSAMRSDPRRKRWNRTDLPLLLMGAMILVLIVFLVMIALNRAEPEADTTQDAVLGRLETLEARMTELETMARQLRLLELQEKRIIQLAERMERMEEAVHQKLASFDKKLAERNSIVKNERTVAPAPPKKDSSAKSAGIKQAKVPPKKREARYHYVKQGETLFSIARANNISVDALRRYNPSLKGNSIFPGQKLKVTE